MMPGPSKRREDGGPSLEEAVNAVLPQIQKFVSQYKDETKLSWVLMMLTIETMIAKLYIQTRGIEGARAHLDELIAPLQKTYGPHNRIFNDSATIEVPYAQVPQFIFFNVLFSNVITQLCVTHEEEHVAAALLRYLIEIAVDTTQFPAVGVKSLMRASRDLQSGLYNFLIRDKT
jgi:hypothetical protein